MPRAYSLDLRQRFVEAIKAGSSARAAGRRLLVSASTAVKWAQRWRQTGSVEAKPMHGHPPVKLAPHKDLLLDLLAEKPDLTLEEIRHHLAAREIVVGKSAIHSFLQRHRISFKKKTAHAAEQERPDVKQRRQIWHLMQPWIDPERLVFLDETGFTTKLTRLYGRCPIGERLVSAVPHGHGKTLTFIAALRHNQITAPWVIDGAMTGVTFCTYLRHCLVPTLTPGDIVVMDNLPAHKVADVRGILNDAGAQLWYLPPYSPDLNPIEQVFAKLKALIRKAAERTISGLQDKIGETITSFDVEECANYFRHAGYA